MFYCITLAFEGPGMSKDEVAMHIRNAIASEPGRLHPNGMFAHIKRRSIKVILVEMAENEYDL